MEANENKQQWASMPREVIEAFGDEGDFGRQHLLNPAIFGLLGEVTGKRILDAGCGSGYLSRLLAEKGARVTGLEPAQPLFEYAVEREQQDPLGLDYIQADLRTWRSKLRFEVIIANMVLMDILKYEAALDTCFIHLQAGGQFVFSITHPCFEASDSDYRANGYISVKEYFQTYPIQQQWGQRYHRPLSHYFNALIQRGGIIQSVIEPKLDEAQAQFPIEAERNVHVPGYLVIQVKKPA